LLTLRGTPFVYMGDEIGQADGEIPPDRVVDIDGRDPERTPVQWDGTPGAGFGRAPRPPGSGGPRGCRSAARRPGSTWPPSATTRPPCSACTASSSGTARARPPCAATTAPGPTPPAAATPTCAPPATSACWSPSTSPASRW